LKHQHIKNIRHSRNLASQAGHKLYRESLLNIQDCCWKHTGMRKYRWELWIIRKFITMQDKIKNAEKNQL